MRDAPPEWETTADGARPSYLHQDDVRWLDAALDAARAHVGAPWYAFAGAASLLFSEHCRGHVGEVLLHELRRTVAAPARPVSDATTLRRAVFTAAASRERNPEDVLRAVAGELGLDETRIRADLFSDVAGESIVVAAPPGYSAAELRLRTNFALAQALLGRTSRAQVLLRSNARAVVRYTQRVGLISTARRRDDAIVLDVSGPYAIVKRTRLYRRVLAGLLPQLADSPGFLLEAELMGQAGPVRLWIEGDDPIFWRSAPVMTFDSQLERRFARDFARLDSGWRLWREPEPVVAGESVVFPDFAAEPPQGHERWLIEIAGYWTSEYLQRKCEAYAQAGIQRLILLVDEGRQLDNHALAGRAQVIKFRRRVDAGVVLAAMQAQNRG